MSRALYRVMLGVLDVSGWARCTTHYTAVLLGSARKVQDARVILGYEVKRWAPKDARPRGVHGSVATPLVRIHPIVLLRNSNAAIDKVTKDPE